MRMLRLEYQGGPDGLHIGPIDFGKFCLLVGARGAGKTTIMRALSTIAVLRPPPDADPSAWMDRRGNGDLTFEHAGNMYRWQLASEGDYGRIVSERLDENGITVLTRSADTIVYDNKPFPQLAQSMSALELISDARMQRLQKPCR